jgi:hypothetical protein
MSTTKSPRIANRLLAALPKRDYQTLQRHLEEVPLVFEEILYQPDVLISDVYFLTAGSSLCWPLSTATPRWKSGW